MPGEDGKDRGAKQVEDQVEARLLIEHPELGRRVGGEDQDRAGYLDYLVDDVTLAGAAADGEPQVRTASS
jgi:hypothetical protein